MKLYRALSDKELVKFLELNKLHSKEQLMERARYLFVINQKTNWVDTVGLVRFRVKDIAQHQPRYSGIIVKISFWRIPAEFSRNPLFTEEGKYYCTKTHLRKVLVEEKYDRKE